MIGLALIIICCAVVCVWLSVRPRRLSPPVFPGAMPLIGHAYLGIGLEPKHFWELEKDIYDFCSKNGGVAQILIRRKPVYIITDLEDCLAVANTCLDKEIIMYNYVKEMYNRGLLTAGPSTWKSHRKLLSPVFSQQVLNTFVSEHNTQARSLVSQLAREVGKAPFDIQPYLISHVLRTVYRTTLGMETDEEIVMKYSHATESLFALYLDRFQRVWLHCQFIFNMSAMKKKKDELMNIIKNITNSVINERKFVLKQKKNLESGYNPSTGNYKPLLDHLLDLADTREAFTDEEIREHLDTIIAGAYDSTTKALVFTLIFVGSNQEVQTKLYEELQTVFEDVDRDLNRHDLPKLVYLEAVIKESLRLLPPAPRIARTCRSPVKLKNYTLPARCTCVLALSYINRNSMWGADAEQFKPERWLNRSTLPDNPNAFATFGLGKRNCIGKQYAIMAIKTYLANILRRYRVTSDISKLETRCDIFLTPVHGHHISLELRK